MAHTYTYAEVLNFVGANFNKVLTDSYGAVLCDQANSMIWNAADWRVSLASLAPFYLSPLEQDYGAPVVQVPTDFLGLRTASRIFLPSQPPVRDPLNIARYLQATNMQGMPTDISYEPSVRKFRVFPRVPSSFAANAYMIDGTYKKTPTKVTPATLASTTLPFDDTYFHVFTAGLLYRYFAATADPRAGNVQTTRNGNAVYSGQLGAFVAALHEMANDEALNMGDVNIAPSAPLFI
jgi:hypothetical protein